MIPQDQTLKRQSPQVAHPQLLRDRSRRKPGGGHDAGAGTPAKDARVLGPSDGALVNRKHHPGVAGENGSSQFGIWGSENVG